MGAILSKILGLATGPLSWLVSPILDWITSKLTAAWTAYWAQREADKKIDDHAKEVSKEMQDAKTSGELDQADRDILSGGKS